MMLNNLKQSNEDIIKGYETIHKPFPLPDLKDIRNQPSLNKEDDMNYSIYKGIKITKRTDGRWQAKYQINNIRKTIYGATQKECFEKLKSLFEKQKIVKFEKSISFYEYWEYWYKNYKKPFYKEGTLKNYRSVFKNQIQPNFPDKNIKQVTALEINLNINKIPDSRMKEYACQYLKEIFKQAYKDKKIKFDIWEDIKKYHHKREEGSALTIEQRNKIIDKAQEVEDGDIFIFYLFTGCRPGEALKIKINDFEKDLLHIPGTKTDGSDRWIPIFSPVKEIFERRKNNKSKKLFEFEYKALGRRVKAMKEVCKFNFQTKDLRTTFGTMCAEKGISQKVIAKWMGHTTTQTTSKYYIKILDNFEKEQIKLLDPTFDDTKRT